jgi:hypothetical protein
MLSSCNLSSMGRGSLTQIKRLTCSRLEILPAVARLNRGTRHCVASGHRPATSVCGKVPASGIPSGSRSGSPSSHAVRDCVEREIGDGGLRTGPFVEHDRHPRTRPLQGRATRHSPPPPSRDHLDHATAARFSAILRPPVDSALSAPGDRRVVSAAPVGRHLSVTPVGGQPQRCRFDGGPRWTSFHRLDNQHVMRRRSSVPTTLVPLVSGPARTLASPPCEPTDDAPVPPPAAPSMYFDVHRACSRARPA